MNKLIRIITLGQFKNFLLFLIVFFFGFLLFFLKPQVIIAYECNNGPSNSDSGGCGIPCGCGSVWTLYEKDRYGEQGCDFSEGKYWWITKVSEICSTADKCLNPSDNALRAGY